MLNINVLYVDTNDISIDSLLDSTYLSKEDIESLSKYKTLETKKEKAVSLILKNKYIKDYYLNEYGKPLSDKCHFNISHSHGVVVFVMDTLDVGIDIEKIRPIKPDLVNYISLNNEKEYIKDEKTFFEVWTNKEALTKCVGVGIKNHIKDIPALPINNKKYFKGNEYYGASFEYKDFVITLVRESDEKFDIKVIEGNL